MDTKQFFKDVYEDFFGVEKIKAENEKLAKELGLNQDYPTIELNKQDETKEELTEEKIKETKDEFMLKSFEKLEKLYITEQSKNTLKKIIEYMRKYSEGIEKQYIPFNMCIYSNNKETIFGIIDIISDAVTFFSYIKRGATIETSFYNLEKPEQINEIYSKENNVIVLRDFEGLSAKEKEFKDRFLHNMKEKLEENQKDFLTILISKTPETIEQAMQSDMIEKYFEFKIESTNMDVQDVYQEVLSKLKESSQITDEASIKLLDYIAATYPKTDLSFPEYRDKLCNKILFSKEKEITENDLPKYEQEKSMDEIFADLNNLVGLENIKQVLKDLVDLIELKDSNITEEKKLILSHLNKSDYIISMCIEGVEYSTIELKDKIDNLLTSGQSNITFIIGGSDGLDNEIKSISNELISFSKLTYPHGLFRLILLEQIYRVFKIMNNETYHK